MPIAEEYLHDHFRFFNASFKKHAPFGSDIANYFGGRRNLFYVCPLCVKNWLYVIDDSLYEGCRFNKDHFPPQSVGGSNTMLVCEQCNCSAGSEFDYILKDYLNYEAFSKKIPGSSIPVKHSNDLTPGRFNGKLFINESGIIEFKPKKNPDKSLPPIDRWLKHTENSNNWSVTATINHPIRETVAKAFLKTAYLYCFLWFGYEFIYSENGNKLRQVFAGEIPCPLDAAKLFKTDNPQGMFEGLFFIQNPVELQSIVVHVPLISKTFDYKLYVVVPIPFPSDDGWSRIQSLYNDVSFYSGNVQMTSVKLPNYLLENELDGYSKCCETWRK